VCPRGRLILHHDDAYHSLVRGVHSG
jgi:hypothetical protein